MITLITAVPGSGKSLLAVGFIHQYLSEGRAVYANVAGLKKDAFPNSHLLFDAPDDWRDTPHGSVVIYDECQQPHLYPATAQRGQVADERLTAMETHRHSGHDLFFITQAPTFVHHHVRKLVGRHIHLYRGSGAKLVGRYEWSHTCDSPNDRREQERADFQVFKFNSEHFKLYQSSTVHTHKFKIPKKITAMIVFVCAVVGLSIFAATRSPYLLGDKPYTDEVVHVAGQQAGGATAPAAATTSPLHSVPDDRPLSGCMASESRGCRCWDANLQPLFMPEAQCRALLLRPLPRTIIVTSNKTT